MPNKVKRYKRGVAGTGRMHVRISRTSDSVKALLERVPAPTFARIADQASAQSRWREWLISHLPQAIAEHLSGVVERDDTLTVFTESAAWSARARYAMAELESLIKKENPGIREVRVRVLPKDGATPKSGQASKPGGR